MTLWTPYSDLPLDLSKSLVERQVTPPGDRSPSRQHKYYVPASGSPPQPPGYTGYYYSQEQLTVPSQQPSPTSSNSSWSSSLYPSVIPALPSPSDTFDYELGSLDDLEYQEFERNGFQAIAEKNGGNLMGSNPRMRRAVLGSKDTDVSYRQQRARNNQAAKQSRDRRKIAELRLAFQVSYLKKKVAELRARLHCPNCHSHDV